MRDMAFVKVGSLALLPPGTVAEVVIGDDSFAVCNHQGEIHALWGICPHAGGPIGQGNLIDNYVVCPWHEWEYDVATGENDMTPDACLKKYPVKIEGDDILIDPQPSA